MKHRIADLLDTSRLQSVLDSVYISTKIASAIVDIDGRIHTGSGWQDICTKFHRVHPEARKRCTESDLRIGRSIRDTAPYIIQKCRHGMVDSAIPIVIEGERIGSVFTGQLFLEVPDLDFFRSQARAYGFDEGMYMDAVKKVPIVSERTLRDHLTFLVRFTELIAEMGMKHAREKEVLRKLRDSEQRFRNIFRKNGSVMLLIDPESGRIEDANPAAASFYGYPEDVLRTMTIDRIRVEPGEEAGAVRETALCRERGHGLCCHRFEPFFTTKRNGTGLGLSTVYGIIKQFGGTILPYSEPGIGTTFRMYLPRVEDPVEKEMRAIGSRSEELRGNETVLLMEDDGLVGNLVKGILGQHGYLVIQASGDDEAIELCGLLKGKIHLLLTDVIMPGIGGMKLSQKLNLLQPAMKVLFMSGYTSDVIETNGFLVPGAHFIQKPFAMVSLLRKVRMVLDSDSTLH